MNILHVKQLFEIKVYLYLLSPLFVGNQLQGRRSVQVVGDTCCVHSTVCVSLHVRVCAYVSTEMCTVECTRS